MAVIPVRLRGIVRMLAVDPGLSGTGWALWTRPTTRRGFAAPPDAVGVFTPSKALAWDAKVSAIAMKLDEALAESEFDPATCDGETLVVVEMPEWQGSVKRAMTWTTGDMQKLTYLVGYLGGYYAPLYRYLPVLVRDWKGQLPKDVVQRRIERKLGLDVCQHLGIKTHAWDAVGVGLYMLGV